MAKAKERRLDIFVWVSDDHPLNHKNLPRRQECSFLQATGTNTTADGLI